MLMNAFTTGYSREGGRLTDTLPHLDLLHALPSSLSWHAPRPPPPPSRPSSFFVFSDQGAPRLSSAARYRARDPPLCDQAPSSSSGSRVRPVDRHFPRQPPVRQPLGRLDQRPRTDRGAACSGFQILRRDAQNGAIISGRLRRMAGAPVLGSSHLPGDPARIFQRRVWPLSEGVSQVAVSSSRKKLLPRLRRRRFGPGVAERSWALLEGGRGSRPEAWYRGTSFIRKHLPLRPYSRPVPLVQRWSSGGGAFFYERGTHVDRAESRRGRVVPARNEARFRPTCVLNHSAALNHARPPRVNTAGLLRERARGRERTGERGRERACGR